MQGIKGRVRNFYLSWYPQDIREKPQSINRFNRILLGGLLLRFIFMPFAAHNDFLSEHVRVYQLAEGINFFPSFFQFFTHYIDAVFMRILLPLIPDAAQVFVPTEAGATTIEIENMMNFVASNYIFRTLFILKMPYLLFELAAVFMVIHLVKNRKNTFLLLKFWMFNPAIIYAVYIFGRYEIYVYFIILLSLYFAIYKKKYCLSGIFMGISVLSRAYTIFLIPVFLILLPKKMKDKAVYAVFSAVPVVAVFLFNMFYPHVSVTHRLAGESQFLRFMLDYSLIALGGFKIQLFFLFYLLFIIVLVYLTSLKIKEKSVLRMLYKGQELVKVSVFSIMFFIIFYLTTPSAAQWFSWVMLFAAIAISRYPKYLGLFFALTATWFFYWIFKSDVGVFTPYLFTPLDGTYFHQLAINFRLHIQDIQIGDNITAESFINFFRTAYSTVLIWIMFLLCRDVYREARGL